LTFPPYSSKTRKARFTCRCSSSTF